MPATRLAVDTFKDWIELLFGELVSLPLLLKAIAPPQHCDFWTREKIRSTIRARVRIRFTTTGQIDPSSPLSDEALSLGLGNVLFIESSGENK